MSDGILTDEETFVLTVTPVNDPPTISLPESFTFAEDNSLLVDFSGYISDIDEDALTLSVTDNDSVTVDIVNFDITFGSVQDWNGTETVTFTVNDDQGRLVATDEVDIIVTPVNDAPVLSSIGVQSTPEDTSLTILLSAEDVDDIDLVFSVSSLSLIHI